MNYRFKNDYYPFRYHGQDEAYLYVNASNQVVYNDFVDSLFNFGNKSLRRYVIKTANLGLFIRYYQLRLHPAALKHVVK